MNSQFSTGFVIALVIGIAVGAFWPKYGVGLGDTALDRDQDAREVSFARASGQKGGCGGGCEESHNGSVGQCAGSNKSGRGQGGRGCGGGCEESHNGSATRAAGRGRSGRGQGGRGCSGDCEESHDELAVRAAGRGRSGRGQGGRGCSGDCEESHDELADHRAGHGRSGRGMGRRGRTSLVSTVNEGCRERQVENTKFAKAETCQESSGRCTSKTTCSGNSGGSDCEKTLTATGRGCNASGEDHGTCASKDETASSEKRQRGRGRDTEHVAGQHRGPGMGLGLGLGRGWGWEFANTDAAGPEDDAQTEAKD